MLVGGGSATARSANQINDGEWHTLELNRTAIKIEGQTTREAYGSLTTDGEIDTVKFPAGGTSLNIALPIYIGGKIKVPLCESRHKTSINKRE